MSDINPYASPANSDDDIPVMDVEVVFERPTLFRDEKLLVMQRNSSLPDRCIKSNEPAYGRRLKRSLSWHHPAIFLAVLVSPIIYIILALVLRKQATIYVGLSEEWFRKRRMAIFWGWSIALTGFAMMIAAIAIIGDPRNKMDWAVAGIPLGILMMLFGAIYGLVVARLVTPAKIDERYIWLKGVHPDYLAELPDWPYV